MTPDNQPHISEEKASGGEKSGVVRYVLGASLLLAIILLSAIWMTGTTFQ